MTRTRWLALVVVLVVLTGGVAYGATGFSGGNFTTAEKSDLRQMLDWYHRCVLPGDVVHCTNAPPTTTTVVPTTTVAPTTTVPATTTTRPATTTVAPTTTTKPVSPPSGLHVANAQIVDGAGRVFKPVGANVGTYANFDWAGVANGHSNDAVSWGWNTVRLNICFECGFASEANNIANAEAVADEYTSAGIVVIITSHDLMSDQAKVQPVFTTLASRYKANPLVWFDPNNEPNTGDVHAWASFMQSFIGSIRATGNTSIITPDAIADAEDAGWDPAMLTSYAGLISDPAHNLAFQIHNYGSYTDTAGYQAHLNSITAAGFAVFTGETGYKLPPYEDPGNKGGTLASFGTTNGALAWHGTHADGFSLKADGAPFYGDGCASCNLSDMGAHLWALTH